MLYNLATSLAQAHDLMQSKVQLRNMHLGYYHIARESHPYSLIFLAFVLLTLKQLSVVLPF